MPKIGPLELDTKVLLTGVVTLAMGFTAMVGGWYKFDARVTDTEKRIEELREDQRRQVDVQARLVDTLNKLNNSVGRLEQRLDDSHVGSSALSPGR